MLKRSAEVAQGRCTLAQTAAASTLSDEIIWPLVPKGQFCNSLDLHIGRQDSKESVRDLVLAAEEALASDVPAKSGNVSDAAPNQGQKSPEPLLLLPSQP